MGKKIPVATLLIAVTAVIVFIALKNLHSSSRPDNLTTRTSPSNPPSARETDNTFRESLGTDSSQRNDEASDEVRDNDLDNQHLQDKYAEVSNNPDYPQLETRLDAMRQRHHNKSFDAKQVISALAQSEAWVRTETPPEELPLTPAEKFDGREFIRFNPLRIETLMPGDTLEIPIWQQGARYKMRVDYAETHANGSVTWHGHLENFNDPHRVTLTVGDGLSLGGIDTPGGHYVLQAHGESGWIASSETLFKRNENETDMIIPPAGELEGSP